jgi:hypothetical protein
MPTGSSGAIASSLNSSVISRSAKTIYNQLLPYAQRYVTGAAHAPNEGPVALYLGMLAILVEDWDVAEGHLNEALASSRVAGSPPYEAICRWHFARLGLARRPGRLGGAATRLAGRARGLWQPRRGGLRPADGPPGPYRRVEPAHSTASSTRSASPGRQPTMLTAR